LKRLSLIVLVLSCAAGAQALYQYATVGGCVYTDQGRHCSVRGLWLFLNGIGGYSPGSGNGLNFTNVQTGASVSASVSRPGSVYCSYPDGGLVSLGANHVCVEQDGLVVQSQSTNYVLQSQALATAPWATDSDGVTAAPTVTNNTADILAPDGTQTVTKIVIPAVSGAGAFSIVKQPMTLSASNYSLSAFVAGSAPGTVYLYATDGTNFFTVPVTYGTAWQDQRYVPYVQMHATVAPTVVAIGVNLNDAAQASQSAQTIYVWGVQLETQAVSITGASYPTRYIPTAGTTATRSHDNVSLNWPFSPKATDVSWRVDMKFWKPDKVLTYQSAAGSLPTFASICSTKGLKAFWQDGTNNYPWSGRADDNTSVASSGGNIGGVADHVDGGDVRSFRASQLYVNSGLANKVYNGSTLVALSSPGGATATGMANQSAFWVGWDCFSARGAPDGWITNVCLDNTLAGCTQ
jgi:hypothetical protein